MLRHLAVSVAVLASTVLLLTPSVARADSEREDQWYLDSLDVIKAQDLSQGEGVTIGVIDTGVDTSHPNLKGAVKGGVGFNRGAKDGMTDEYDHGTGIASIIAGNGRSGGILGIAPKAKLLSVAVCDSKCDDTEQGIRDGIQWLVEQDVDIITISMASDPAEQDSIDAAVAKGIPIVAIAGNLKVSSKDLGEIEVKGTAWPGIAKGVIPVSGTTSKGEFWDGSQDLVGAAVQPQLGLSAPATDLPAASSGGGYATHSGTSGSAPIVAGTLALIKSAYPDLTYFQWVDRLLDTTDDKGPKGFDDKFGAGIVNPYRALTEETKYTDEVGKVQVSSPDDRLPLAEQGKGSSGASGEGDDKESDGEGGTLATSGIDSTFLTIGIVAAVVVAVAVLTTTIVIVAAKRRRAKLTAPTVARSSTHESSS